MKEKTKKKKDSNRRGKIGHNYASYEIIKKSFSVVTFVTQIACLHISSGVLCAMHYFYGCPIE